MTRTPVFALVDCNNFFVSCERVFRPDLWHQPVAVLSNNDGCIVARSNEVKALGVPMGVPYFKVRDVLKANNVTLFSGNFPLYGDFSQRVVQILQDTCPDIEVYSVDESFLEISRLPIKNYTAWGQALRAKILQYTGVPVSVGIAPSKTLAKGAADYAKKQLLPTGAFAAVDPAAHLQLLQGLAVQDVWGVGRRTAPKLLNLGIRTAHELSQVSNAWAQSQLTIRGVKMVRELRGESCLALDNQDDPQQSILRSRSFGHTIRDYYELESAVATFTAQAGVKLRAKQELAGAVATFLYGSKHSQQRHGGSAVVRLTPPTNDTGALIAAALQALHQVYDPDFGYKKAGIVLASLRPASAWQLAFNSDPAQIDRTIQLNKTIDALNQRYGTRLVRHASEHPNRSHWFSRRQLRSPAYTTNWADIPTVHS